MAELTGILTQDDIDTVFELSPDRKDAMPAPAARAAAPAALVTGSGKLNFEIQGDDADDGMDPEDTEVVLAKVVYELAVAQNRKAKADKMKVKKPPKAPSRPPSAAGSTVFTVPQRSAIAR